MRVLKVFGVLWLGFGCIAAAALMWPSNGQAVGQLLIVPAIVIGLLRIPAGIVFRVVDGWPVLTLTGIALVYIVPSVSILVALPKRR